MVSIELLLENNGDIESLANLTTENDVGLLLEWLNSKNDDIRYNAFLLLKEVSKQTSYVYPYWNVFVEKLASDNSYQRSIGSMILAENSKWDEDNLWLSTIDQYLSCCDDEKFITARQAIQGLKNLVIFKSELHSKIANFLMNIDVLKRKDSQRKLLLMDILYILIEINKINPNDNIIDYIYKANTGAILDKKSIKAIDEAMKA